MPASLLTSGPAHVFVGGMVSSNARPGGMSPMPLQYLGTCERAPHINITRVVLGVRNDLAGEDAMDLSYQGQFGHLDFDLTRWDPLVYRDVIASFPHQAAGVLGTEGVDVLGDVGTLMITEGRALEFQILFPYSVKPVFAAVGMDPGYRFFGCFPAGDDQAANGGGTQPKKLNLQAIAKRVYDPMTGAQRLYDKNVALATALAAGPL